jgi:hypothetical protein
MRELEQRMKEAAEEERFEDAASPSGRPRTSGRSARST